MKKLIFIAIAVPIFIGMASAVGVAVERDGCQIWAVEENMGVAICPDTSSFRFTFFKDGNFEIGDLISKEDGTFSNWEVRAETIVLKKEQGLGAHKTFTISIGRVYPPQYDKSYQNE